MCQRNTFRGGDGIILPRLGIGEEFESSSRHSVHTLQLPLLLHRWATLLHVHCGPLALARYPKAEPGKNQKRKSWVFNKNRESVISVLRGN